MYSERGRVTTVPDFCASKASSPKMRRFRKRENRRRPGASARGRWVDGDSPAILVCAMRTFTVVVERDPETGLFVGYIPGWPGAHSQGATLDELRANLREVASMLLEDGEPRLETEFIGTEAIAV
jgi:predicted RNase H-like HicB family nuclease